MAKLPAVSKGKVVYAFFSREHRYFGGNGIVGDRSPSGLELLLQKNIKEQKIFV